MEASLTYRALQTKKKKTMWAFIGQWGGNYLMTDDGKLAEENNTAAELIKMYNNNLTLTRDKLPD